MVTIKECVERGMDREKLIEMLIASAKTRESSKANRLYVGIPVRQHYVNDERGERLESILKEPILLYVKDVKGFTVFYRCELSKQWSGMHETWFSGNGNITLSPWDSQKILSQECISVSNSGEVFIKD